MPTETTDYAKLKVDIQRWGMDLGFQQIGISDIDLSEAEDRLASRDARNRAMSGIALR